jgi:hypothetical protein
MMPRAVETEYIPPTKMDVSPQNEGDT